MKEQYGSYSDEIETRNREDILFSSRVVLKGILVTEGLYTAFRIAVHLYSDQANTLMRLQRRLRSANSRLGS